MTDDGEPNGLEASYGAAATPDRKTTGDPSAPPAAATDTLNALQMAEAEARTAQAGRAADEDDEAEDRALVERRKRAYHIWEQDGRPEGRQDEHWHAAGEADEPGASAPS